MKDFTDIKKLTPKYFKGMKKAEVVELLIELEEVSFKLFEANNRLLEEVESEREEKESYKSKLWQLQHREDKDKRYMAERIRELQLRLDIMTMSEEEIKTLIKVKNNDFCCDDRGKKI